MEQGPPPLPLTSEKATPPLPRSNGAAIASLVCGVVLCIPAIPQLLAVILGWIGLRVANEPGRGGRGMAVVGMMLGLAGMMLWIGVGIAFIRAAQETPSALTLVDAFVRDLCAGDIEAAQSKGGPAMSPQGLQTLSQALGALGSFNRLQADSYYYKITLKATVWELRGQALFQNGARRYTVLVVKEDGQMKVHQFQLGVQ